MGKRSTGRKLAMQALYQAEIQRLDIQELLDEFLAQSNPNADTRDWAKELAGNAFLHIEDADTKIKDYAINWDLSRLNLVDKSILRLAIYELDHTETPINIVLNEAIEIAREFSTDESPKFINGILGNYIKRDEDS